MTDAVTFPAQVARVQTLADGGLRVTFDLPEGAVLAAAQLMEFKRWDVTGEVTYVPHRNGDGRTGKGNKRQRTGNAAEAIDAPAT